MRLSSTPPNNFCKAIVNQPASLQQRQGLTITKEVEERLISAIGEKEAWILEQLKKHNDNFHLAISPSAWRSGNYLEVLQGRWTVWVSDTVTNHYMPELQVLLQDLPRLAERHPPRD
jgi:hypothetical protein